MEQGSWLTAMCWSIYGMINSSVDRRIDLQ
jgi:hypothetical protein